MILSSQEKQRTLRGPFSIKGKGLHSGSGAEVRVKPAPAGTGIVFRRSDIPGSPWIPASVEGIYPSLATGRQTTLGGADGPIGTVEHLLSVFCGMGIDNAHVEVDGPEMPGLDGSGEGYCAALEKAGIEVQSEPRKYFKVEEPVFLEFKDASTVLLPFDGFKVSYTLSYGSESLADQFFESSINEEVYRREIAPARTFVLKEEAEALMAKGYGKGADFKNTLVFENNQPMNNQLRYRNEAARHKVFDLIGDLYLLGCRIKGHIVTSRTGHAHNLKMVLALRERLEKNGQTTAPSSQANKDHLTKMELDINHIKKILPHRYPFLFVDRVTIIEEAKRAIGIKNVTVNDYFFQGHFPGHPVMPGVIIVEALAQAAGVILLRKPENYGKLAYFMTIDGIKFRQPVVPGDQLKLDVTVLKCKSKIAEWEGKAYVGEKLVCEAILRFAIV